MFLVTKLFDIAVSDINVKESPRCRGVLFVTEIVVSRTSKCKIFLFFAKKYQSSLTGTIFLRFSLFAIKYYASCMQVLKFDSMKCPKYILEEF